MNAVQAFHRESIHGKPFVVENRLRRRDLFEYEYKYDYEYVSQQPPLFPGAVQKMKDAN